MKKSYKKIIIFEIILAIFLISNSFILNILGNYYYVDILLLALLLIFKILLGFEKGNQRYIKDIISNILIIYLISFIFYYIFGIFIGFVRTNNYLNIYGITRFIFPYIIMIILREYLREQLLNKTETSKILTITTCILFILLEFSNKINNSSLNSNYSIFLFIALSLIPIISNNIVSTYVAKKVGCKPNIFWLTVAGLYGVILPFTPNVGPYIESLIMCIFPFIIMYNIYTFFTKRERNAPISYIKKRRYIEIPFIAIFVFVLAYFVSGLFKYYAIAISSGSMTTQLNVGDVVIVNRKINHKGLEKGDIIAYRYDNIIVVHRICDIIKSGDDYYFYTKGDANTNVDNYIIYSNTIIGKVESKIPYIGLPTVWINKLFE